MSDRFRVLVHCGEPAAPPRLAGPAIRALAFARELAGHFSTDLAMPPGGASELRGEPFGLRVATHGELARMVGDYDLVVSQGMFFPARGAVERRGGRPVRVFDLYDPVVFEQSAGAAAEDAGGTASRRRDLRHLRRFVNFLLVRADMVLCASPAQRDLWTGALASLGRLGGGDDPPVAVAPFGHDGSAVPAARGPVMRGVIPGIGAEDRVLLWGGGVWNWFDPLTLIRAVADLGAARGDIKLVFLAGYRPGVVGAGREMLEGARALARELGAEGRSVFFHDEWVAFDERGAWLRESDLAVCTAPDTLENRYSFRTRLTDAVWAGVPVVCTRGGFMADFVESYEIGLTVRAGDVKDLSGALSAALEPPGVARFRANLAACRDVLRWDVCLRPLVDFAVRVRDGDWHAPEEGRWRPWARYAAYKVPSMLEKILGG